MKAYWVWLAAAGLFLALMQGCAPSPLVLHPGFGNSVKLARQSQIYNPEASKNLEPIIGMHGRPVGKAVIQFEKSFDQKQKKSNQVGILVTPSGN